VEKEWSKPWNVEVPSKIKFFLWRLARQSLPTADVLHHRNMKTHDLCTLCGGSDSRMYCITATWRLMTYALYVEALTHGDMPFWSAVWPICMGVGMRRNYNTYMWDSGNRCQRLDLDGDELNGAGWSHTSAGHNLGNMVREAKRDLWRILLKSSVNKLLCEAVYSRPGVSYYAVQQRTARENKVAARPPRWIPPPPGLMKINVDAAMSKNTGKASYAAVAWNSSS
jgi:hypothetical protein